MLLLLGLLGLLGLLPPLLLLLQGLVMLSPKLILLHRTFPSKTPLLLLPVILMKLPLTFLQMLQAPLFRGPLLHMMILLAWFVRRGIKDQEAKEEGEVQEDIKI